jgi:hypothetical protein
MDSAREERREERKKGKKQVRQERGIRCADPNTLSLFCNAGGKTTILREAGRIINDCLEQYFYVVRHH